MEEELRLLDWQKGEKIYIQKMVDNYLSEQAKMPLGFMISKKTLNKNIEKIKEEAKNNFREMKLHFYESQIYEERKRISVLVDRINCEFLKFLNTQSDLISKNIKPFKINVKDYKNYNKGITIQDLEVVIIQTEPFKLSFLQEKVGDDNE